ncbi:hypothetical protein [Clostridium sp.]|uniref:hypothetical protein n=1 Tax=Clostridium sp. TaxID=1506 RepID=UPI001A641363|nr:hypothetical protein [Clostridium sp.]MBK5242278.1 hypothetical protein [Clostridium sp.]
MNNIEKLVKDFKYKQKKHKINSIKGVTLFAGLGIAIGGTILGLLYQRCCSEITHIIIKNAKDFDEDINEGINIESDEIKQTLKNKANEPMGDVGSAMKEALEDLEVEEQDENDVTE